MSTASLRSRESASTSSIDSARGGTATTRCATKSAVAGDIEHVCQLDSPRAPDPALRRRPWGSDSAVSEDLRRIEDDRVEEERGLAVAFVERVHRRPGRDAEEVAVRREAHAAHEPRHLALRDARAGLRVEHDDTLVP